jgi:transmembrane sensor
MEARYSFIQSGEFMDYTRYSAEQFAFDPYFIQWVKEPHGQNSSFWLEWLAQHPDKANTIDEARQLVLLFQFRTDSQTSQTVQEVWERIRATTGSLELPAKKRPYILVASQGQRMAAVLTATLLIATFVLLFFRGGQTEYRTQHNTETITLPDGSTVVLNMNSRLSFNNHWEHDRNVWLEGEAFFSVRKKAVPGQVASYTKFIVHAGQVRVEVLGTSFNVWQRENKTKVVLKTGKIRLLKQDQDNTDTVFMKPNEIIELQEGTALLTQRKVDARVYTSWKDNQLILENTSLQEVKNLIEMRYGYRVEITDSTLLNEKITFKPVKNDLTLLIKLLTELYDVEVHQPDKLLVIQGDISKSK